jgi:hypothetical protein
MFYWIGQYIGMTASEARALVVAGMKEQFDFWAHAWRGRPLKGCPPITAGFHEYLYYMGRQDTCGTGLELQWFAWVKRITIVIFTGWSPDNQRWPYGYHYDCGALTSATGQRRLNHPEAHPVTIATGWYDGMHFDGLSWPDDPPPDLLSWCWTAGCECFGGYGQHNGSQWS